LACKLNINAGDVGFGTWGGSISFPTDLVKGDTFWLDQWIYMPPNPTFIVDVGGSTSLKYIRFRSKQRPSDASAGFIDIQPINDSSTSPYEFRMIKEGQDIWENFGLNIPWPRGQWVRHSVCVNVDNVAVSSGGTSRVRFWQNGTLLYSSTGLTTITRATDILNSLYLFTNWNGGSPQTQSLYMDDIKMAASSNGGVPSWAADLPGA
jgi:hypothetical protein